MNTIERYIFKTLISFPLDSGVDESCAICVYFVRHLHSALSRAFVLRIYIAVISYTSLRTLVTFHLLLLAILTGVRWSVNAVLTWVPPISNDAQGICVCSLSTPLSRLPSVRNAQSDSFLICQWLFLFQFLLFLMLTPYQMCGFQIFSPILKCRGVFTHFHVFWNYHTK